MLSDKKPSSMAGNSVRTSMRMEDLLNAEDAEGRDRRKRGEEMNCRESDWRQKV